jgi:hypothetical protein
MPTKDKNNLDQKEDFSYLLPNYKRGKKAGYFIFHIYEGEKRP